MDTEQSNNQKPSLPQSSDSGIWEGEKRIIDMSQKSSILCSNNHDNKIDPINREVICQKCGRGFRFLVSDVVYKNGELFAAKDFKSFRKGERIA